MKRLFTFLILFTLVLTGCSSGNTHENETRAPKSRTELKGKDYKDVVILFEEAGFTNIETEKIEDLITGWLTKDGEVESVSIGGDSDFSTSKWYSKDSKVRITYHTFPEEDDKKEDSTTSTNSNETIVEVGGYKINIPSSWENDGQFYYAEKGTGTTMFYPDVANYQVASFDDLDQIKNEFFDAFSGSFGDVKNVSIEKNRINGKDAIVCKFDSTVEGVVLKMELYLLVSPDDNSIVTLMFGQSENSSKDYFPDFYNALDTLRFKDEELTISEEESNLFEDTTTEQPSEQPVEPQVETIDVYTIDNCDDLSNLLNSAYVDADVQATFANKYKGKKVEFDAVVVDIQPAENSDWVSTYIFAPDLGDTVGAALFIVKDAVPAAFKWDKATRPEYLSVGSKVRIQAEIKTGDDPLYVYLKPTKTWGR